jgi:histidine ammonia-lyase
VDKWENNMKSLTITGHSLGLKDIHDVAVKFQTVGLAAKSRQKMLESRRAVLLQIEKRNPIYGVTTGIGKLSDHVISTENSGQLQLNIIRSHACGVGPSLEESQVRAALLVRANTLAKGLSGVRPLVVESMLDLLNHRVYPLVPRQGSVGASGDLVPSAHATLVLIGEGSATYLGVPMEGSVALRKAGLSPLTLEAKEGISIINGTHFMSGIGALCLERARRCIQVADLAGALSLEALMGTPAAFDPRLMDARPHPGQRMAADHLRNLLKGSRIVESHHYCRRVQDAYSLRCIPQVHGAVRDALHYADEVLRVEINSAVDNPLVFSREDLILSGGNFHGAPVALALDFMAIALTQAATMSERRLERLINPDLSGLPAFLSRGAGLESGFMMAQVTAAALASECKVLAHPACADSISTSGAKEDHVSMGMHAALKLADILNNYENLLAIELLAGCHALELLDLPSHPKPGWGTRKTYRLIRQVVPPLMEDRVISGDIEKVRRLIAEGTLDF